MFDDPKPLDGQVEHLRPLWHNCWVGTQIVLAVLATKNGMYEYLIRCLYLPKVMPMMAVLSTSCLDALLAQAFRRTNKTIRRRRQTTIMAIFRLLPL